MNLSARWAFAAVPALWAVRHLRSPAVRAWDPPTLAGDRAGSLYARWGGDADQAVVLLHGLVSSGDLFGASFDELAGSRRLVVPDLLGFGRSIDEGRSSFSIDDHLGALDELAERIGLFERRWTIGAHSMGSALALHWAARHRDRVDRVLCWGAPIYRSPEAARQQITGSAMTRLFAVDTAVAERACAISCRHRSAAGWITAALEPTIPVPVSRAVALHTWPAYRDSILQLVIEPDWQQLLTEIGEDGVNTELVWGTRDRVGDHSYARELAAMATNSVVTAVPEAGHHLPMTHPRTCLAQLARRAIDPASS